MLTHSYSGAAFDKLASLVAPDAVRVDVEDSTGGEGEGDGQDITLSNPVGRVEHLVLRCSSKDKLLHVLSLLRLGRVKRKALIFVGTPDAAVRLRLFLEKFGVRAATLHGELPVASRAHALGEFNRGLFDYLIATDDTAVAKRSQQAASGEDATGNDPGTRGEGDAADEPPQPVKKRKGSAAAAASAAEFGVFRGVDFKDVRTVINLEVPPSAAAYTHRVGRCARGGGEGTAITLVSPAEEQLWQPLTETLAPLGTCGACELVSRDAVEALRYRAEDMLRACSRAAVREARLRELRVALLNSDRLAAHFEDNPRERQLLAADAPLVKASAAPHLKHLPVYLRGAQPLRAPQRKERGERPNKDKTLKRKRERAAPEGDASAAPAADGDAQAAPSAAPPAREAAAEAALLSRSLWGKKEGPKRRRGKGKDKGSGPEWPTRQMGGKAPRRNVMRGKRKKAR